MFVQPKIAALFQVVYTLYIHWFLRYRGTIDPENCPDNAGTSVYYHVLSLLFKIRLDAFYQRSWYVYGIPSMLATSPRVKRGRTSATHFK